MLYVEKPAIILRLPGFQNLPINKIPSLHGHFSGLLRQPVQVAPSTGTRLANVWQVDIHWRRLLRLVLGLIRCEIEREAKIETIYCSSTASRRMPSNRTTPRSLRSFGRKQEAKKTGEVGQVCVNAHMSDSQMQE
jgi:hypothetical protein